MLNLEQSHLKSWAFSFVIFYDLKRFCEIRTNQNLVLSFKKDTLQMGIFWTENGYCQKDKSWENCFPVESGTEIQPDVVLPKVFDL